MSAVVFSSQEDEIFIEFVRKYPILYDKRVDDPGVVQVSSASTCSDQPDLISSQCNKNTDGINDLADLGDRESGPRRPNLAAYKRTKFGEKFRSFRCQWYTECDWLEYSVQRNAAFCFVCRIFGPENSEDAWTRTGFNNWKKLIVKLKSHLATINHKTNESKMMAYKSSEKTGSVVTQLSSFHKEEVARNCKFMSSLIEIILYIAKQGIALRGHNEGTDSINQAFIKKKINLTSWKIQEELIKISADLVTETIVGQILDTGHFALMVDEARSHKQEQLSVCVRYAVGLDIYERFLQFVDVSCGQNANQIVSAIYSSFKNCNLNMDTLNIVAQSYDGASVMSGHIGGVQAKIKEDYPYAIYTHCMAHRLNLVVVDLCKEIKNARCVFNTLEMVYVHFARPSNNTKLGKIQLDLGLKKGSILRVCDTRWVCRFKNCEAMISNYTAILEYLSILRELQKYTFFIGVILLKDVLGIINILSTTLQSKTGTLGKAKNIINGVILSFEKLRCET
ncbi:zinc finger MYM-type protein 1-like [Myzus persicae]|uniref:zinc finger MYM-type protein 1-like n=1 Tax=Myzus persicae TaxID=13164 RepID=UPI000B93079A|nr:zinc finger MYM-type protein 1-like [Myzus persicae]